MIRSIEKSSGLIGNRTGDFPAVDTTFSIDTIELKYSHYKQEVFLIFVSPSLKMGLNAKGEIMYL
jgi:hypothetical protein